MNQQRLWDYKWSELSKDGITTNYAKRVHKFLKLQKNIKDLNKVSLLDLGCGDGKDSLYFADLSY